MSQPNWRNRIIGEGEEAPDQLLANPHNWRIHPKAQQDALAGILGEVGWVQRVIVNQRTGHMIDGHLRVELAISRNEPSVPVLYVDLSEDEEKAVLAAFDPLSAMAVADEAALKALLDEVSVSDEALRAMLEALRPLEPKAGLTDPDDMPEPPPEPISKTGDLWLCGDHRLLCGDSTKAEDVERLMAGEKAGAVITDPPYGIDREGVSNDDPAGLRLLLRGCIAALPITDAIVIAFASPRLFPTWLDAVRDAGHHFERMLWLYKQNDCTFPWRGWILTSESILVSTVGSPQWPTTVPAPFAHDCYLIQWDAANKVDVPGWHGSIKPYTVIEDLVSRTAGLVHDPFLGSGTTMIACERLGRRCYGMEIEPRYVDVAVKRWEQFTGREAIRDG